MDEKSPIQEHQRSKAGKWKVSEGLSACLRCLAVLVDLFPIVCLVSCQISYKKAYSESSSFLASS